MSSVVYLNHFRTTCHTFSVTTMASNSWWVYCHKISDDGRLLPCARVVFFSRSREEAQAWILQQESTENDTEQKLLSATA